jgi:carbamoyl-phosphate synthase small subunit
MGGILLLEDGRSFEGEALGARGTRVGEVVFNTAMTGYQEILTDPSYAEQIVVMTASHIGNTGVNEEDPESARIWPTGFVARSFSRSHASHRATDGLEHALRRAGLPAVQGIDTRALVRHIRSRGAMRAVISTDGASAASLWEQLSAWPGMVGRALALEVGVKEPLVYANPASPRARVTVIDCGVKTNILRMLASTGCAVRVESVHASAEQWMEGTDLLFLSNGPGDPAACAQAVGELRRCLGKLPIAGICLGHQLLGLALGADTFKLRFGHRGANHPVRDEETGRIEITSQNHGFCVDPAGVRAAGGQVTHINLNDGTLEGFRHADLAVRAVQYHPESAPGPHDSRHLILERFLLDLPPAA